MAAMTKLSASCVMIVTVALPELPEFVAVEPSAMTPEYSSSAQLMGVGFAGVTVNVDEAFEPPASVVHISESTPVSVADTLLDQTEPPVSVIVLIEPEALPSAQVIATVFPVLLA